ncbi:pol polyprotein [Tanacetum coccineum]
MRSFYFARVDWVGFMIDSDGWVKGCEGIINPMVNLDGGSRDMGLGSMFEISGNNFNDWFCQLKMVLRVERKLFVIEQPISLASPTDSEYLCSEMRYMIHNEELKSMFEKQVGVEWFDPIQTFHGFVPVLIRMTNTQTPPNATTVVNTTGAPVTNAVANHAEKPKKFNGQNFKRWHRRFFYSPPYALRGSLKDTCTSGLKPPAKTTTAKELWESLERKYKTEDAGTKKFVVARFLDYKMVDSKNVISQVQDLQVLLHDIHAEGMTLSETFQVAAIIEKLPPSWVEFKNYLKHKRKEMSVEDLVVRLRIEEDNKLAQKDTYTPDSAKANMVEHAGSSSRFNSKGNKKDKKKNDKKGKGKSEYLAPKAGIVKQKFQGTCYNCDQPGHRAANCKMPKRVNPRQANMVDENMDMIAMVSDVCAMISEVNLVGTNNRSWWIDTGATRHVYADKSMFHSFRAVKNGQKLYMGNSATVDIKGEGYVILKMTSEKELKLTNVLYVL